MMGHKSKDTGNRIYNHKTLDELKEAIELITRTIDGTVNTELITK